MKNLVFVICLLANAFSSFAMENKRKSEAIENRELEVPRNVKIKKLDSFKKLTSEKQEEILNNWYDECVSIEKLIDESEEKNEDIKPLMENLSNLSWKYYKKAKSIESKRADDFMLFALTANNIEALTLQANLEKDGTHTIVHIYDEIEETRNFANRRLFDLYERKDKYQLLPTSIYLEHLNN